MHEWLDTSRVLYGLVKMPFGTGQFRRIKWVWLQWVGDDVPPMTVRCRGSTGQAGRATPHTPHTRTRTHTGARAHAHTHTRTRARADRHARGLRQCMLLRVYAGADLHVEHDDLPAVAAARERQHVLRPLHEEGA